MFSFFIFLLSLIFWFVCKFVFITVLSTYRRIDPRFRLATDLSFKFSFITALQACPYPLNQHKNWRKRKTELRMRAVWVGRGVGWNHFRPSSEQNRTGHNSFAWPRFFFSCFSSLCRFALWTFPLYCQYRIVGIDMLFRQHTALFKYIYTIIYTKHTYMLDIYRTTFFFFFFSSFDLYP